MFKMSFSWKKIQRALKDKGYNPGVIDGIKGPNTINALKSFQRDTGLEVDGVFGPISKAALFHNAVEPKKEREAIKKVNADATKGDYPIWLRTAKSYVGLREIRGRKHNKQVLAWWKLLKLPFKDDETPWCAGFVNGILAMCKVSIPAKYRAAALGWRWQGHGTLLKGPALGAIMEMERPGRPGSGHITFVAGKTRKGYIAGLGGNQGNAVSVSPYSPTGRNAKFRWPPGVPLPKKVGMKYLPVVSSTGKILRNEA